MDTWINWMMNSVFNFDFTTAKTTDPIIVDMHQAYVSVRVPTTDELYAYKTTQKEKPGTIAFSHSFSKELLYFKQQTLRNLATYNMTVDYKPHVVVVDNEHPAIFIENIPKISKKSEQVVQFLARLEYNGVYDDTFKISLFNDHQNLLKKLDVSWMLNGEFENITSSLAACDVIALNGNILYTKYKVIGDDGPPIEDDTAIENVQIVESSSDGAYIKLFNGGNTKVDIGKWELRQMTDEQVIYKFESGTELGPNSYLIVWSNGTSTDDFEPPPNTNIVMNETWNSGKAFVFFSAFVFIYLCVNISSFSNALVIYTFFFI